MENKSKYGIIKAVLSWIPAVAVMVLIFFFSSQISDVSSQTSMSVLEIIERYLNIKFNHEILRKCAHAFEFFVLGITIFFALYVSCGKKRPLMSLCISVAYAVSDEVHQIFVPGRACRLFDIFVDSVGIAAGVLICMALCVIIGKIMKKDDD